MKKILFGFLALLVVAVAAALAAPSFIDWNAYRAEIAAEVRKATGRVLAIDGDIAVALLPRPMLSVTRARLANLEGAKAPDMIRLEALDVRAAFWPLLSGKVVVDSVVLRGAEIELERLADGRANWEFGPPRRPAQGGDSVAAVGGAGAVSLEQVTIADGRLTYRDSGTGIVHRVEKVEARIAAGTLSGPFVARGRMAVRAVPVAFELRTGNFRNGGPVALAATLEFPDAKAKASLNGTVTAGTRTSGQGRIEASGPDLSALVAALGKAAGADAEAPPLLARKFTLSAALSGDDKAVRADDVTLDVNGTRAAGAVDVSLGAVPAVNATIGINNLDLDAWLAASGGTPAPPAAAGGQEKPGDFALPADMRLSLDATVAGISYNKGAIRDLRLTARLERGVAQLTRASALLPGGSEVTVTGRLSAEKGEPRFDGRLEAGAGDVRALAGWLGVDLGAIAADRLHRVSLTTNLGYVPGRVEAREIDLRFDSTRVGGGVVVALRDRVGIGASLEVDSLNLDAYLADAPAGAAPGAGGSQPKKGGDGLAALGGFDANLRARAGALTFQGVRLGRIDLDGSLVGGTLTLRDLRVGDLAGGELKMTGTVRAIDTNPVPDLTLALSAREPAPLFALAGLPLPVEAAAMSPFALEGRYREEKDASRLTASLKAGPTSFSVDGTVADLATAPRVALDVKAGHPDFVRFVRLFDPAFRPAKAPKGPFSLAARIEGAGLDARLTRLEARLGEAELSGTASLALAAVRPKLTADLKAKTIVADHFLPAGVGAGPAGPPAKAPPGGGSAGSGAPWSDEPLDLDGLNALDADVKIEANAMQWRSWQVTQPRIDVTLNAGRLDIRRVSGRTVGGSFLVTGGLAAPAKPGGPAELRADLDITRADLRQAMFNAADIDIAEGRVDMRMNVTGKGASSKALVSSLGGAGTLKATDGAVRGFNLGRVNDQLKRLNEPTSILMLLQTAMSGGTTRFSELTGTFRIEKGVVRSDDIRLVAEGGQGQGTLVADLPRWHVDADGRFRLAGHPDAPPFGMQLKGPLDSPSRIFKVNELQAWLVGRGVGTVIDRYMKKPGQAPTTEPPAEEQKAPSSDEFIRGIFDLLNQGQKR